MENIMLDTSTRYEMQEMYLDSWRFENAPEVKSPK